MNLPRNAVDFINFMESIWEMRMRPVNGGIELGQHPYYDLFHNAMHTIRRCPAKRTGGTKFDGQPAHVFRFHEDPPAMSVIVGYDGSWVRLGKYPRRKRNTTATLPLGAPQ